MSFTQFSYSRIFLRIFFLCITIFLERNKLSISPSAHIKNNFHNLIMHNKLRQKENNSGRNVQDAICICIWRHALLYGCTVIVCKVFDCWKFLFAPIRKTRICFKLWKMLLSFVLKFKHKNDGKIIFLEKNYFSKRIWLQNSVTKKKTKSFLRKKGDIFEICSYFSLIPSRQSIIIMKSKKKPSYADHTCMMWMWNVNAFPK